MKKILNIVFCCAALIAAYQCTPEVVVENSLQVATQDFSEVSQTQALATGYITVNRDNTVSAVGFCVSVEGNPTVSDARYDAESTVQSGQFVARITDLEPGTTYYGRSFVASGGKTYYGNVVRFTTREIPSGGWCIIDAAKSVSYNAADIVMQIADDGNNVISEYGVCYNTTGNPDRETGDVIVAEAGGAGFTALLRGLDTGTKYYVRPYFVTESGPVYGEVFTFSTTQFISSQKILPGYRAAYMYGVLNANIGPVQEIGFVWGTSPRPTVETGSSFASPLKSFRDGLIYYNVVGGLEKGTTYYCRAYAKNEEGYFYGADISFTTRTGDILPGFSLDQMVKVEAGTFVMGDPDTDKHASPIDAKTYGKEPAHTVQLTKDFYLSCYHITNAQLCSFLNVYQTRTRRNMTSQVIYNGSGRTFSFNTSGSEPNMVFTPVKGCDRKPGSNITWGGVEQFYEWLSAELGVTCRFPTEAEYEYAARGGNRSEGYQYPGSNTLAEVCVMTNSSKGPNVVGSLKPNELGLYDMMGNAFCYVQDDYDIDFYFQNLDGVSIDPVKPNTSNGPKVLRGTSFRHYSGNAALYLRLSSRGKCSNEADCGNHSGFRLVMDTLPDPSLL